MQAGTIQIAGWQHELLAAETARRLLMACAVGGAIGIERELRHKVSGLRTNLLVCMGSALFTLMSAVLAGPLTTDKSRVASNIVTGVGFLGAGLIMRNRNRVHGLTSAATIYTIAAIGMACGAGMYTEATIATVLVLLALQVVGAFEYRIGLQRYTMVYEVRCEVRHEPSAQDELKSPVAGNTLETAQHRMVTATLGVLDRFNIRFVPDKVEDFAGLMRVTFPVLATRPVHERVFAALRASDATDEVLVFRDLEDE